MPEIGMGKGAGVGSFAAGFGKGLSNALLSNRDRKDQKQREEQARKDRLMMAALPSIMSNLEDEADLPAVLEAINPGITQQQGKKGGKKGGSPWEKLSGLLGPMLGLPKQHGTVIEAGWPGGPVTMGPGGVGMDSPESGGIGGMLGRKPGPFGRQPDPSMAPSQQPAGVSGGTLGNRPVYESQPGQDVVPPDISQTPMGGATAPPPPSHTMTIGGRTFRMMTPEQKAERAGRAAGITEGAKTEAELTAKITLARRLIAGGMKMSEAYDRVGLRTTTSGATAMRFGGIMKGDQAEPGTSDIYGRPLDHNTYYRVQIQPGGEMSYTPTVAPGGNLGVDREAISRAMFGGKAFAQLEPPQQQQVLDAEKKRAGEMSETRALGTETGQFRAPIDVTTAQNTNLPVGTTSADVAGQTVQTTPDRERVQSLTVLRGDLTRVQDLLGVLPSEKSLAGVAPGAVLAARKRMNSASGIKDADGNDLSYRSAIAQLTATVDSMVNVLARVRGEQRGTQTERDADRAYNAVVQLQAGLLDPLGGDTQESAKARITEALAGLDRVLGQIPTQAVPNRPVPSHQAAPAAAPAAGPPGITMKNGKLYGPDGKLLPGQ